jgi:hypothetical protein
MYKNILENTMLSKIKYIISVFTVLFCSFSSFASGTTNFAVKNHSDKTYYYVMDVSSEFPMEKIKRNSSFTPFIAKRAFITFGNELQSLNNLDLDTTYKGQLISEDTIKEMFSKVITSFQDDGYLFIAANLDKFAMRSGILKVDIKLLDINNVIVTGPGSEDKEMLLYARKIVENSNPAKKSFVKKYLWMMKRVNSYISSYKFVEMENNNIELIVETKTR